MFSLVVLGVAAAVFVMYFRHDREMKRRRALEAGEPKSSADFGERSE